jgi:Ribonuclease HII
MAAAQPRPNLKREEAAWSRRRLLIGVDEVGRGPLAGPVVAAAVVFPAWTVPVPGVRDSKTLSENQRAEILPGIKSSALIITVAAASVREVDRYNIRVATALAMRRAVARTCAAKIFRDGVRRSGATSYQVLIDGLAMHECGFKHEGLVDGDAICYSIAAPASSPSRCATSSCIVWPCAIPATAGNTMSATAPPNTVVPSTRSDPLDIIARPSVRLPRSPCSKDCAVIPPAASDGIALAVPGTSPRPGRATPD